MKQIRSALDIKKLGTILSVWAHPDDETFLAAGLLSTAVDNGQTVVCVTATKGEAGVRDSTRWPAEKLAEIRERELSRALEILGVQKHHWLGCYDGRCRSEPVEAMSQKIAKLIRRYQPDTIITFGPDGFTGHDDHKAVSAWVTRAIEHAERQPAVFYGVIPKKLYDQYYQFADRALGIFFNTDSPPVREEATCDICFNLPDAACQRKSAAFAAMPSQMESLIAYFGQQNLKDAFACEAFVRAKHN